jgi:putative glutamine amidotransferase
MNLLPKVLIGGYQTKVDNYESALKQLNIIPIVAFCESMASNYHFLASIDMADYDGLLLPGGGDIDPHFFHKKNNGSRGIDFSLDMLQFELLDLFVHAKKPVLGICKGLQIINVFFGGNVIQDLPTSKLHAWDGEDKVHPTTSVPGTFISCLYGKTLMVNSAHHQGIGALGKNLFTAQASCDSVVEAFYHESLPILAVQWHPERMSFHKKRNDTVDGKAIFEYFKDLLINES